MGFWVNGFGVTKLGLSCLRNLSWMSLGFVNLDSPLNYISIWFSVRDVFCAKNFVTMIHNQKNGKKSLLLLF